MLNKLLCYVLGHKPFIVWRYKNRHADGGEVAIDCKRCFNNRTQEEF